MPRFRDYDTSVSIRVSESIFEKLKQTYTDCGCNNWNIFLLQRLLKGSVKKDQMLAGGTRKKMVTIDMSNYDRSVLEFKYDQYCTINGHWDCRGDFRMSKSGNYKSYGRYLLTLLEGELK